MNCGILTLEYLLREKLSLSDKIFLVKWDVLEQLKPCTSLLEIGYWSILSASGSSVGSKDVYLVDLAASVVLVVSSVVRLGAFFFAGGVIWHSLLVVCSCGQLAKHATRPLGAWCGWPKQSLISGVLIRPGLLCLDLLVVVGECILCSSECFFGNQKCFLDPVWFPGSWRAFSAVVEVYYGVKIPFEQVLSFSLNLIYYLPTLCGHGCFYKQCCHSIISLLTKLWCSSIILTL